MVSKGGGRLKRSLGAEGLFNHRTKTLHGEQESSNLMEKFPGIRKEGRM